MKYLTLLILLTATSLTYANEDLKKFNEKLLEQVEAEIQNDDFHLRQKHIQRGPASVEPARHIIYENPEIDKARQTGHTKW